MGRGVTTAGVGAVEPEAEMEQFPDRGQGVLLADRLPTVNGLVVEALPGATFKVKLDDERELLAYTSGKMRLNRIKILPGDKVQVEMTKYDDKRGRITRRL